MDTLALGKFLHSCPSLAELKIRVADAQLVNTGQNHSPFSLPRVEAVSFEFPSCSHTVIKALLGDVRFPAASKLVLVLGLNPSRGHGALLTTNMAAFFADQSIFPAVTRLKLTVTCNESGMRLGYGPSGAISIPFSFLGGIRHLILSITGFSEVRPPAADERVPPLRSLRLQQCDSFDVSWLLDVLRNLNTQGDLGKLEVLSTSACGSFLRDIKVNCHSIPQGTLLEYLKAELPLTTKAPTSLYGAYGDRLQNWINSVSPASDTALNTGVQQLLSHP